MSLTKINHKIKYKEMMEEVYLLAQNAVGRKSTDFWGKHSSVCYLLYEGFFFRLFLDSEDRNSGGPPSLDLSYPIGHERQCIVRVSTTL